MSTISWTRNTLAALAASSLLLTCHAQPVPPAAKLNLSVAPGPFQPTMESLTNYHCPDWFRDAKFGIWAHWGPQAVPMAGDWYARHMYVQGHAQYQHHLENYGHPSTNGYKEIIQLWKAEKWDPDRLMALYKQAGAKYFVSMGSHHDNFYLWNSKLHPWNAVNMGPHRDVVADWQRAAKKAGLRFGVSEHLGASYTWFQDSHKSDKTGPLAGVPYDGADPKFQDLCHFPADPSDKGWYSANPRWQQQWFDRIKELVDNYHPDLLYTDGGVPFGEVGRSLVAHFYNADQKRRGGRLEAVYTCKKIGSGEFVEGSYVQDMERGVLSGVNPRPWQTDTSIGDWFYNKNWKFRPVNWTIHMLADIVSKNGNLLLNVVQRPDGSLDPEVEQALGELAQWIAVHGEAIYGTRPWLVYGEGRVKAKGGHFKEDFAYTAQDIRFTTKGKTLYAIALGWPADGRLVIKSLATPADGTGNKIQRVELLGFKGKLDFTQTPDGLVVKLPDQKVSDYTAALKITGTALQPVPFAEVIAPIGPDAKGNFRLGADDAELHGQQIKTESQGGQPNIGFWDKADEWASWKVQFTQPGRFNVSASVATTHGSAEFALEASGQRLIGKPLQTAGWADFKTTTLGQLEARQVGEQLITLRATSAQTWKPINLRWVKFERVAE
ncbi:MAG: alpha-L-fucosidase [Verrucomicrobia bacterium]|nr:alpha-L-fucosidase [Verrucomicrobiota bacterium]